MQAYMEKVLKYTRRRGTILVLLALLVVCLLGFTALAVDLGMIATAQAQLKTVTDAAALAGARQLASDRRVSSVPIYPDIEIAAAINKAMSTGNANSVLAQAAALTSTNIVVGYINTSPANPSVPIDQNPSNNNYNSVQVTASITVPAFFASIFRSTGSTVTVSSTATVGLYAIGYTTSILPITMDTTAYGLMIGTLAGGGDKYSFTAANYNPPASNGVSLGADKSLESVAYPVVAGLEGNWGTINFGVSNNSTAILGSQIRNGMTSAQMNAAGFSAGTDLPLETGSTTYKFSANPGISAGIKDDLTSIIGKPVAIPIYYNSGGKGNNAWYEIKFFAPARIVAVNMTGNDKYVIVQPASISDLSFTPDTTHLNPWSEGGVVFVLLTR